MKKKSLDLQFFIGVANNQGLSPLVLCVRKPPLSFFSDFFCCVYYFHLHLDLFIASNFPNCHLFHNMGQNLLSKLSLSQQAIGNLLIYIIPIK